MGERPSATEPSSPTAANASVGASTLAQARSTVAAACPGASRWPSRPTSGRLPTAAGPPTTPEAASPATSSMITVRLPSAFAAKIPPGDPGGAAQRLPRKDPRWRPQGDEQVSPRAEPALAGEDVAGDQRRQ